MASEPTRDGQREFRGLLRNAGLGLLGLAGASVLGGKAVAEGHLIYYAALTPPGEDPEDDSADTFTVGPGEESTADFVAGLTLATNSSVPIGYQLTVLTGANAQVAPEVFEEGSSRCFSGVVRTNEAGQVQVREQFSVEDLAREAADAPNEYLAVLTVVDYSASLTDASAASDMIAVPFTVETGGGATTPETETTTAGEPTTTGETTTTTEMTTVNETTTTVSLVEK